MTANDDLLGSVYWGGGQSDPKIWQGTAQERQKFREALSSADTGLCRVVFLLFNLCFVFQLIHRCLQGITCSTTLH